MTYAQYFQHFERLAMSTFSTDSPAWQDPPRERQLTGAEARQYEKDMNDWFLRVERADDWPDGDEEESNV